MTSKTGLRQFTKDSIYTAGRQVWTILLGLLTSVLLKRGLGTYDSGLYAIAVFLPMLLVTLTNLGIAPALVYYIARKEHALVTGIQESLFFSIISSIAGVALGLISVYLVGDLLFPNVPREILLFSLLMVPVIIHQNNMLTIFQGLQDFRAYNFISFTPQLGTLILIWVFVWRLQLGVQGALLASILGTLLALCLTMYLLWTRARSVFSHFQVTRKQSLDLLTYGLRGYVANLVQFFNYRADIFLLNQLSTQNAVGLYDASVALVERLWIIASSVSIVIFPRVASDSKENQHQITPVVARHVFWFSLLISLIFYGLAEWAIVLLYGEEFHSAAISLRLLLPGIVMGSMTKIIANDVAGRGKPEINSTVAFIALIINVGANLFLIPAASFAGAAIASSISYSMLCLFLVIAFCRLSGTKWYELFIFTRQDIHYWWQGIRWLLSKIPISSKS